MPAKTLPSNLLTSIGALRQYLLDPPSLSADPKSLIQKKRKRKPRLDRRQASDDEDGDEPAPHRQRKKKVAEVQNYKSAAFIDDSDDDDAEADKAFFEKEKQLRERMMRMAEEQAGQMIQRMKQGGGKGKGKGKAKDGPQVGVDGGIVTPDRSDGDLDLVEDGDESAEEDSSDGDEDVDDRRPKRRRSSQVIPADLGSEDEAPGTRVPMSFGTTDSDSD